MREPRPLAASLVILVAGCSTSPTGGIDDPNFDPDRAREVLLAALDAWKDGRVRDLARRSPPIRLVDDDHAAGRRLVDYRLETPETPIRSHADVPVALTLREARGTPFERKATFQVTLWPSPAVLRADP